MRTTEALMRKELKEDFSRLDMAVKMLKYSLQQTDSGYRKDKGVCRKEKPDS